MIKKYFSYTLMTMKRKKALKSIAQEIFNEKMERKNFLKK